MEFATVFPNRKALLCVVHVSNLEQVLRNVGIAAECGADGVFLIDQNASGSTDELLTYYAAAQREFSNFWIGVNFLSCRVDPQRAIRFMPRQVDGLWLDDVRYQEESPNPLSEVIDVAHAWRMQKTYRRTNALLFGGVAFKGCVKVSNPSAAACAVAPYVDVVTTSGPSTGQPPSVGKIQSMREAIGQKPLVIASGMKCENIRSYIPYADGFLVATGISRTPTEFNRVLVERMVKLLPGHN